MHSKAEGRTCSIRWQAEQERRREIQDCYAFQRNVQQGLIRTVSRKTYYTITSYCRRIEIVCVH